MRTLAKKIPLTIDGQPIVVDLILGLYASSLRPCLFLAESPKGDAPELSEVHTILTVNAPPGYLIGQPLAAFVWNPDTGYSTILEDLALALAEAPPLYLPLTTREGRPYHLTLGFRTASVALLEGEGLRAHTKLLAEHHEEGKKC